MVNVVPNVKRTKIKKNMKSLSATTMSMIMCRNILTIVKTLRALANFNQEKMFKNANKFF